MKRMWGCFMAAFLVAMLFSTAGFCSDKEAAATAQATAAEESATGMPAAMEETTEMPAAAEEEMAAETPAKAEKMAAEMSAGVEDAGIGTSVEDRMLVGQAEEFPVSVGKVYCFTRITGAGGTQVKHVWSLNGNEVAEIPFSIGSDSWRTWSSKRIAPGMEGSWTVKVLAEDGSVLKEMAFTVTP